MTELISIARIARPHGVRGEVSAEILTDFPERFDGMSELTLAKGQTIVGSFEVEQLRFHKDRLLLKFAGRDDVESAEELRGLSIVVTPDELVDLEEDEYFTFDLMGCQVLSISGVDLGHVVRVDDYGAAPILVIDNAGREILLPLTREFCPEVDTLAKKIVVNPPEGLLDL